MKKKILSITLSIILSAFLLSVSIALPILIRDFYYIQIESMNLTERTGYSEETIREAYDDILDYCTMGGEKAGLTFRTGRLAWSEYGKEHFDDVERLFHLDFMIAIFSGAILAAVCIISLILYIRNGIGLRVYRFRKRGPLFWGPAGMLGLFGILAVTAAIDFEAFFAGFHYVFFQGKDTWLLDRDVDEIIRILPDGVFLNFGLAVVGLLVIGCAVCIVADIIIGRTFRNDQ